MSDALVSRWLVEIRDYTYVLMLLALLSSSPNCFVTCKLISEELFNCH